MLWSTARCGPTGGDQSRRAVRVRFWHDRGLTIAQIGLLFTLHHQDRCPLRDCARTSHTSGKPSRVWWTDSIARGT